MVAFIELPVLAGFEWIDWIVLKYIGAGVYQRPEKFLGCI